MAVLVGKLVNQSLLKCCDVFITVQLSHTEQWLKLPTGNCPSARRCGHRLSRQIITALRRILVGATPVRTN